jgi:hypothetical protein
MVYLNQRRTSFTVIVLLIVLGIMFFRVFDGALLASPLGTYEPEHFLPVSRFSSMAANHHTRHNCQPTY